MLRRSEPNGIVREGSQRAARELPNVTSIKQYDNGQAFDVYVDGSGFSGIVTIRGWRFAVNCGSRITVDLISSSLSRKPDRRSINEAHAAGLRMYLRQPEDWRSKHSAMYPD